MNNREEVIKYCLAFHDVYEDYPFHDSNWAVMRLKKNKKSFAMVYIRNDQLCVNVKCDPEWIHVVRQAFSSVLPGYHMNKKYWNTLILDGSIPDKDIKRMIGESYDLVNKNGK